jgi:DNA adenine methylase
LLHFPKQINTYYEPFCGGASVLRRLLNSNIEVKHYVCSDANSDLINLWNEIKYNPLKVIEHYTKLWLELNKDDDKERKKQYFYKVRDRFNKEKSPLDFMFIMRTTTNGMPRYNKGGEFNNSFHVTRNGIIPSSLSEIILEWSSLLKFYNVEFRCCSYEQINPSKNDFCYLDPPYANTKGMYYGTIDYLKLWTWIRQLDCKYVLSFDGISGDINNTFAVPKDVYSKHEYLLSGNSSFKRTIGKSNDSIVYESLYIS